MFYPQNEFPLLEEYAQVFPITDRTIFAYDHKIYCNYKLPLDLVVHEMTHHQQQDKYGLVYWVQEYLTDDNFRLEMEIEAYNNQLKSIKDRNFRFKVREECIKHLSSDLYGNIISREQARELLWKK